jgi:hypothetical protein
MRSQKYEFAWLSQRSKLNEYDIIIGMGRDSEKPMKSPPYQFWNNHEDWILLFALYYVMLIHPARDNMFAFLGSGRQMWRQYS